MEQLGLLVDYATMFMSFGFRCIFLIFVDSDVYCFSALGIDVPIVEQIVEHFNVYVYILENLNSSFLRVSIFFPVFS